MSFGKFWIAANQFAEDVGSTSEIVLLAEHQSQLDAGIDIFWLQADRFIQLARGLVQTSRLRHRQAQIVVRLRKIRIGHHCLLKLFEPAYMVVLAPVQQSKARLRLRIAGLQLQSFLKSGKGAFGFPFTLPSNSEIVKAGRNLRALLDCLLKEDQRIVQFLLL